MSITIIQNAFHAFAGQDADRIAAVLTEDAEWWSPPGNATAVALGTTHHLVGRKAIAHFFAEDLPRLFVRDLGITFHRFQAGDDGVTVEATTTATLRNGTHYRNDYCFVFELRDGLIHRAREYVDTARGNRLVFGDAPG